MAIVIEAVQSRRCVFTVSIKDAAGNLVSIDTGDVVRVKLGQSGSTPRLDLDSATSSSNGSTVTATNPATITIVEEDLADSVLKPGTWDFEVGIWDNSQSAMLHAEFGTVVLRASGLGDVGAT